MNGPPSEVVIGGTTVRRGDRVRLHPHPRGDIFDLVLADRLARIDAIEEDFEGRLHLAVALDDDPGAAVGRTAQPGHRFFFAPEEIEPLGGSDDNPGAAMPRVLVAGIGNVFLGDDGFGVEVARRLQGRERPEGLTVADYGIRGYDLAYALLAGYDHVVLVDACPRGEPPGTVFVLEPDPADAEPANGVVLDAHDMNPLHVLRLARSLGGSPAPVTVVGCEPATLGPPEGVMGLSEPVAAAVDQAVELVETLAARLLAAPITR